MVTAGLIVVFIVILLWLLMRKPGDETNPTPIRDAITVPGVVILFVLLAALLVFWGARSEVGETLEVAGVKLSMEDLQATSRTLGVGIITGLVVGAIISLARRWHEFEAKTHWPTYARSYLRKKGLDVVELDSEDT